MQLAIASIAAALAGASAGVAAPDDAIEVVATGTAIRPANLATFSVHVEESGTTDAETRRLAEDRVRAIVAAARAAGVAESDIRASPIGFTSFRVMIPEMRNAYRHQAELRWSVRHMGSGPDGRVDSAAEPPPLNAEARAGVVIRLRDLSRLDALNRALAAASDSYLDSPEYTLTDQREADAAARRQALAMARAEAEAQAASRGLRVARIARVSERLGPQLADELLGEMFLNPHGAGESPRGPEITVRRPLAVTFVLAPR